MNQGLYGMASGGGASVRKLSAQLGKSNYVINVSAAQHGVAATVTTVPISTRTRVLSVTGRGAARYLLAYITGATSSNLTIEVFFDGVRVINTTIASVNSQSTVSIGVLGGNTSAACLVLDWIPFDSSYEVYLTTDTVANPLIQHITDLHQ